MEDGELKGEGQNIVLDRSFAFAVRIVELHRHLNDHHRIFSLSDQVLRAGTSIGANVVEAQDAQSQKDFLHKMSIALKEARETRYWLSLLAETEYLDKTSKAFITLNEELEILLKLLVSITKTSKTKCQ